jgi:regulator of ribosome biosynthesis
VPRAKAETRWQKFARENNIQKTKRSRNVYDEPTGEYLPRWGRGSVRQVAENSQWVIEEKERPAGYIPAAGEDEAYEDPFQKSRVEKKKATEDQRKRERRNLAARAKDDAKSAFAATSLSAASSSIRSPAAVSQARLMKAVKLAQKSTRSMGDYDEHRADEPALRKKRSHSKITGDEKTTTMKVLNKVMSSTSDSASVTGAVNKLLDEQRKSSKRRKTSESN